jgi:hypothetical protein
MKPAIQVYNEIKDAVNAILIEDNDREAYDAIKAIVEYQAEMKLRESDSELFNNFQKLITTLKWVALPLLKKEEIDDLFRENLSAAFQIEDYDFKAKLKGFLLGVVMLEERDELKESIRAILVKSNTVITSNKLLNNAAPTVENWIKKYTAAVGSGSEDTVKIAEFYTSDKDYNALSVMEKSRLKKFFEFFERLKYSSKTIHGVEESIPVTNGQVSGYIVDGKLVKNDTVHDINNDVIFSVVSQVLSGNGQADVLDELNAPLVASVKPMEEKQEDLPMVATQVEPAVIKPAPLVVPKPVFVQAESKKPASYGEERPLKTANGNEAKQKEIAQLRALATNYPEGSLERRVIEDEIVKVENK